MRPHLVYPVSEATDPSKNPPTVPANLTPAGGVKVSEFIFEISPRCSRTRTYELQSPKGIHGDEAELVKNGFSDSVDGKQYPNAV
jgi:hypothetical protein